MELNEVLTQVKALGDPRAIEIWRHYGVTMPDKYFGAGLTKLKALGKTIGKNHGLALQLWGTGVHNAKLVFTVIAEPKKAKEAEWQAQVHEIQSTDLAMQFSRFYATKAPLAVKPAEDWTQKTDEYVKQGGFMLLTVLTKESKTVPDAFFEKYLHRVKIEIPPAPGRVREAINYALLAIGNRNPHLNKLALTVTQQVDPVYIDYGDTSCKAPDVLAALSK